MTTEQLIELIEQYPVLYNMNLPLYRDHNVRNITWKTIAEKMCLPVDEVKSRWGNLRNCYTNALKRRRKRKGKKTAVIITWKYEKQMEFLLPYLDLRKFNRNSIDTNDDGLTQDFKSQSSEESEVASFSIRSPRASISSLARGSSPNSPCKYTPRLKSENGSDISLLKEIIDIMKSSQDVGQKRTIDMDEDDYFFLSMSKQLKKLPRMDQIEIKFQLHKLIHESEVKMLSNCD